jgi:RNA polymerase sigma factor (sigma-70 family)
VIAGAYVRDGDQASECVAESFARVIDAIDAGGGPTVHFDRYLATTVRNMALEHIRRSSRSVLVDDVCALAAHGPVEHEPHQQVIGDLVGRAFDRLSESWREVLWLTEVEGYTVTELADSWGMTPNAVAARAYRAREALREGVLAD